MALDATTQRHLELVRSAVDATRDGTVLELLDQTTAMGGVCSDAGSSSHCCRWMPFGNDRPQWRRWWQAGWCEEARELLKEIADIERIVGRVNLGLASPRDLWALRQSLQSLPRLVDVITALNADALQPYVHDWETLTDVYDDLARALSDDAAHATQVGDVFQPGYHAELDELRQLRTDSRGFLAALEAKERERTGIPGLRLHYNRVFGYIEVSKRALHLVPRV